MNNSNTNRDLLITGLKRLAITVILMFTAPVVIWQAFKNQQHPLYWPVLIVGIILAIAAVAMGFKGIKTVVDAIFGKKNS
ncbi:DUF6095 family protein [Maribacter sp. 2210JD10-5]|uniref:DUF6095 family protein n=1 Tax=Maribacter sp. 2210JD10-5 TaxID=3386272 RepID=UPI0039BCD3BD